jgi:arabinogalactan endo-1,4-beta-galactosidase
MGKQNEKLLKNIEILNMKKRKLNSKNPKYSQGTETKEKVIIKKVPLTGKAKGHGIFYKDEQ